MKTEYKEGPEALENFERGMKTLFKAEPTIQEKLKKEAKKGNNILGSGR